MGLASTLKPKMPTPLSMSIMTETELNERSFDSFIEGTIGTNPETLCIALEDANTPDTRREALRNLLGTPDTES